MAAALPTSTSSSSSSSSFRSMRLRPLVSAATALFLQASLAHAACSPAAPAPAPQQPGRFLQRPPAAYNKPPPTDDEPSASLPEGLRRLDASNVTASSSRPAYADWKAQVLERHNMYRCMHGVPPLVWNDKIEAHAKQWAATGHGQRSPPFMLTSVGNFSRVGESMAWKVTDDGGSRSAGGAVQVWYDQVKNTEGGRGLLSQGSDQTAKYSQLVWGSTTALGCALLHEVLVCQYGPAGNVPGDFAEQVKARQLSEQECRGR